MVRYCSRTVVAAATVAAALLEAEAAAAALEETLVGLPLAALQGFRNLNPHCGSSAFMSKALSSTSTLPILLLTRRLLLLLLSAGFSRRTLNLFPARLGYSCSMRVATPRYGELTKDSMSNFASAVVPQFALATPAVLCTI
jgi:hypothetical protein